MKKGLVLLLLFVVFLLIFSSCIYTKNHVKNFANKKNMKILETITTFDTFHDKHIRWLNDLTTEYMVPKNGFSKWQKEISNLERNIMLSLDHAVDSEQYNGVNFIYAVYNYPEMYNIVPIGVEIFLLEGQDNEEQIKTIVNKCLQNYDQSVGRVDIKFTMTKYSQDILKKICEDIQHQSFFTQTIEDSNATPYIVGIGYSYGTVNILLNQEFPLLNKFLTEYPYADCIKVKLDTIQPLNT